MFDKSNSPDRVEEKKKIKGKGLANKDIKRGSDLHRKPRT